MWPRRVLIVDDENVFLTFNQFNIKAAGVARKLVSCFASGKLALKELKTRLDNQLKSTNTNDFSDLYFMIWTDFEMKGMNGDELIDQVKKLYN